jgi:tetraacyldisaccharide 4'-kinase
MRGGFWDRTTWLHYLLSPFAALYALGWEGYVLTYRLGIKKAAQPHSRVVCVGNLRVGGTGKSPFTLWLAQALLRRGHPVVLGMSGYGSPAATDAQVAPDGPLNPFEFGDEVSLAREKLPDVPIIVGRARVSAARLCNEHFPDAILLMDDGFQHLPLKKSVTIVLDPDNPPNAFCFPVGPYREPRWNRRRADLVLPSERFKVFREPTITAPVPDHYYVVCALAQPRTFISALEQAGVLGCVIRPDHDRLDSPDLLAAVRRGGTIVTTGKDWVKLRQRSDHGQYEWVVCDYECRVEPEEEFMQWLIAKLGS